MAKNHSGKRPKGERDVATEGVGGGEKRRESLTDTIKNRTFADRKKGLL